MSDPILPAMTHTTLLQDPKIISPLISATILADSISPQGVRMTTLELIYPRMILAELNTHRVFSKNSASSRAIPTKRMIKNIRANPAVPASWRLNQAGMQGYEVAPADIIQQGQAIWLDAMEDAIRHAERLDALGLHKQIVNRLTEPFVHMKTVLTGVYFENFDGLRRHHMADPTIEALAWAVYNARQASTPTLLRPGEWHLPYITDADDEALYAIAAEQAHRPELAEQITLDYARKVSAARCARTSYNNMEGKTSTLEEDIALHDRLLVDQPIHASPAEHQGTPDEVTGFDAYGDFPIYKNPELHGNLHGWVQYRKTLANENMDRIVV